VTITDMEGLFVEVLVETDATLILQSPLGCTDYEHYFICCPIKAVKYSA